MKVCPFDTSVLYGFQRCTRITYYYTRYRPQLEQTFLSNCQRIRTYSEYYIVLLEYYSRLLLEYYSRVAVTGVPGTPGESTLYYVYTAVHSAIALDIKIYVIRPRMTIVSRSVSSTGIRTRP